MIFKLRCTSADQGTEDTLDIHSWLGMFDFRAAVTGTRGNKESYSNETLRGGTRETLA